MKTPKDIKDAIDLGLHMNLDNELEVGSNDINYNINYSSTPDKYC